MRPDVARRPRYAALSPFGTALLAALVVSAMMAFGTPSSARASTTMVASCGNANLRTDPSTSNPPAATIPAGSQVTVDAPVPGGSWSATCPSGPISGSTWYPISEVNGQPVSSLPYGVSIVYGATGLFQAVATPTPTPTATPDPLATPTPTPDPFATPTPTPAPDPFATPTPTPDPFATPTPTPTPSPTPFLPVTEGIDVSHWQNTIDWTQVAAAGKRFAFMKASEGTTLADATYATNRAQAKAVGLYVGAYHFARPDRTPGDPVAEADYFLSMSQLETGDLVPVLDLEDAGGLSPVELQEWVKGYLGRIYERTGARGMIYASPTFWKNAMGDTTWFATNGFAMVWVAHWTTGPAPTVPAQNWGGNGWTFWQYTSSGSVPGIGGRVDLDRFNGLDLTPMVLTSGVIQQAAATLDITPSTSLITWGDTVVIKASFGILGAGRTFDLQAAPDGATWQTIATLTADTQGNASFSYRPATNLYYRGAFAGAPDLAAATSPTARVVVRQTVLLRPTASGGTRTVRTGQRITFTMTVRPRPSGPTRTKATLDIYRRVAGRWTLFKLREVYVDSAGVAVYSWAFPSRGDWYVRAFANRTSLNATSGWSPVERYSVR
ncbi:MAG TPA: glycoside hydrolase family 25 protein [Candidatus Limnocylindrales bacterium]